MIYYLPLVVIGCLQTPEQLVENHKDHTANIGLVSIKTNGVVVDEMIWERPWTDIEISIREGANGQTATLADPIMWSGVGAIHVRGNSSSEYDKKQYALEIRDENGDDFAISPFGLPIEADWILHAPYSDKTLLRNHLMFYWSRAIGRYAPRTRFVELYMEDGDGDIDESDYHGLYVFTEKIKRDPGRVNVEKLTAEENSEPNISGGYLEK